MRGNIKLFFWDYLCVCVYLYYLVDGWDQFRQRDDGILHKSPAAQKYSELSAPKKITVNNLNNTIRCIHNFRDEFASSFPLLLLVLCVVVRKLWKVCISNSHLWCMLILLDSIMFGIISQCFVDFKHLTKDKMFPFGSVFPLSSILLLLLLLLLLFLGISFYVSNCKTKNKRLFQICCDTRGWTISVYVSAQIVVMRKKNTNNNK